MKKMAELSQARELCVSVHSGQTDKNGAPYYLHPFAVADMVDGDAKVVAYLHDVVEDTGITLDQLEDRGFSKDIVDAVDSMTRRAGEDYLLEYLPRLCRNELARTVKRADLTHNTDKSRLGATEQMREKYKKALDYLDEYERRLS